MDLNEFVSETLVQIQQGVEDAIRRRSTERGSGAINPVWGASERISREDRQNVEFDVAITVTDKTSGSAKGGLRVFSIELGGEGSKAAEQSTVSRIRFSVPIVPPVQLVHRPDPPRRAKIGHDPYGDQT